MLIGTDKKAARFRAAFEVSQGESLGLTRIEFDDQVRFHDDGVRHVGENRYADEGRDHLVVISFDVVRNVAFSERNRFENGYELLGLFLDFDDVARLATVGTDVDADAVDLDVAVVDELTGSKDRRNELGAVDDRVEARFEQADQVFRGVTLAAVSFGEDRAELLLADVAVVALELLLGAQLYTEVRELDLRRWPCWPGPYSRRFTGDFGRPQMFSPIRRSILYLDDLRLLIAFPFKQLHRPVSKPDQGNTPSSEPIFGALTGFSRSRRRRSHGTCQMKHRTFLPGVGAALVGPAPVVKRNRDKQPLIRPDHSVALAPTKSAVS